MLSIPNVPIPIPSFPDLLPVPTPGLSEPLFTVALVVAGVLAAIDAVVMFVQFAGYDLNDREMAAAMAVGYGMSFAYGYATARLLFWLPALGMYVFEGVRLRLGLSRREVVTEIVLWLRRRFGNLEPRE